MARPKFDEEAFRAIVEEAHKEHPSAEVAAEHALRRAILEGVFSPGSHLSQDMLAELLMSSRGPVLSALHALDGEGLVDFIPNRGAFVRKLSLGEIRELYQLRILLGRYMVRLASERAASEDLDDLDEIAQQIVQQEEGEGRHHLIDRFYSRLYEIADQSRAAKVVNKLRAEQVGYWLRLHLAPYKHQTYGVLVQALRDGKTDQAEEWLEEHLTASLEVLEEKLVRHLAEAHEG